MEILKKPERFSSFGELMGQSDVLEFLEREYSRNPKSDFYREDIKKGSGNNVGNAVLNHSLRILVRYREIERIEAGKNGPNKIWKYRYLPHESSKVFRI
jgi:hypothetical protein